MCESYIGATEKSVARIRVSQAGQFIRSMFWIGCIGFGGGSALIPVIEKEIADLEGEINGRRPRKAVGVVPRDW